MDREKLRMCIICSDIAYPICWDIAYICRDIAYICRDIAYICRVVHAYVCRERM